jgi:hypothetical protein
LKNWFRDRTIRIPNSPALLEQLEALRAEELRRRDRVRFTTSGEGHDDAAIALCLSAEGLQQADIGALKLPDSFRHCWRSSNMPFDPKECFVVGPGWFIPAANDPCCKACHGLVAVKEAYQRFLAGGGSPISIREFRKQHMQEHDFTSRVAQARWEHWYL